MGFALQEESHIVKRAGEAGQQAENCEADAKCCPQAELALKFGAVAQSHEEIFVRRQFAFSIDWYSIACEDRCHRPLRDRPCPLSLHFLG